MSEKVIGVITQSESDILKILESNSFKLGIMKPGNISRDELDACHSIAILGGTEKKALLFHPRERILIEEQLRKGKKIFSEFCDSIGNVYSQDPATTRLERLCFCHDTIAPDGIAYGDILDDQCNSRIKPWDITCSPKRPLLQYARVNVHSKADVSEEMLEKVDERAVWFEDPEHLLICAFRMSNFKRARFSPSVKWMALIKYILEWLCDEKVIVECLNNEYYFNPYDYKKPFGEQLRQCLELGIEWFKGAGLLINNGKDGVMEGMATEIYPDGSQKMLLNIRHDCIGEVSFAYFMKYLMDKEPEDLEISKNLSAFCFDHMQIKDDGPFKGMMRWSNQAWAVCYQDDVARTIIPEMLKCLYLGENTYLDECIEALRFLVRTTGIDGTRVMRTDIKDLNDDIISRLSSHPGNFPSAHYNAYYLAALLLAYKLTSITEFRDVGVRGLETIMSVYPETIREHSETQELCRLILPLTYLYWITKDSRHKSWLYRVVEDLQRYRHAGGGYLEWDTGYKSTRFGKNNDECSLLTKNGDPVVDMLYSLNWLPAAFIQAYLVTGDRYFKKLWEDIAEFLISTQLHSANKQINGGWARAMDVEMMDVFALPNDLGWGPWAIESGWTVAEIISGLTMGVMDEKLMKYYAK